MKKLSLCLLAFSLMFLTSGCSSSDSTKEKIIINGSTSVAPLMDELAAAFMEDHPDKIVEVSATGSSDGINAVYEKTADIGMSSRRLVAEEKLHALVEYKIAIDGIAVIVNPNNPIKDLKKEQLLDIYTGKTTNFKDVGGDDKEIAVISRESGSGTRGAFEDLVGLDDNLVQNALVFDGTGAILSEVSKNENAIGYVSVSSVDDKVAAIGVNGVVPNHDTILNNQYLISRPFIIMTQEEPKPLVNDFISFIFSEKGMAITNKKYLAIPGKD